MSGGGAVGHLLDPDYQRNAGAFRCDRPQPLMHCGRAGGAGILHPGRRLETQIRGGLQDQRGGEVLGREPGIEMAEHDLVHIARLDAGIRERIARDPGDQALDRLVRKPAERGMGPSDDTGGHGGLPDSRCLTSRSCRILVAFLANEHKVEYACVQMPVGRYVFLQVFSQVFLDIGRVFRAESARRLGRVPGTAAKMP